MTHNSRGNNTSTTRYRTLGDGSTEAATTTMVFDAGNRVTKTIHPDLTESLTSYNAIGKVATSTDALGHTSTSTYDEAGRRVGSTDALNHSMSYTLNAASLQTHMTDALGNVTETQFDVLNRPVKTIYADGNFDTTEYDTLGRRVAQTDADGKTTRYEYDTMGRMTAVIDALNQRTEYTFDEAGHQLTLKDALGRITRYEYDLMGRRTKRTLPGGQIETYAYDTAGRVTTRTDFNGYAITYSYDPVTDRLIQKQAAPGHPSLAFAHAPAFVRYDYDLLGRRTLSETKNSLGTILHSQTWTYDNRDRVTATTTPLASLAYTYDAAGNLTSATSSTQDGYAMSYEHDALNRMSAALDHNTLDAQNQPARTEYAYTDVGALSSVTLPNTLKHFYNYNARHQLTSCGIANAANQTVLGYAYTLNATGMRTQTDEFAGAATPARTVNYLYDALHRLTQERSDSASLSLAGTVNYTLDAVGNRNARTSTLPGVPNQSQTVDNNDRITTDTTDANGNTTASLHNGVGVADVYDFEDKLIRRVESTGKTIDILYDADGNRVAKSSHGLQPVKATHYLVDTNNPTGCAQVIEEHEDTTSSPIFHLPSSAVFTACYAFGLDLISQDRKQPNTSTWTLSYYLYDGGGHVRALSDAISILTDSYTYDAYGVLIASSGTTTNNYLYRGEQWDADLGLYYQRARYLNPATGRFWTQDS